MNAPAERAVAEDGRVRSDWWPLLLTVATALVAAWVGLVVVLVLTKPEDTRLRDAMRLLPDLLRLSRRLAADRTLPRGVRVRLFLLLGYLASPIDLVPDVIPVIGYADDAIIVAVVLRSVARRAGPDALQRHWPGSPEGLAAVRRLCRLPTEDG